MLLERILIVLGILCLGGVGVCALHWLLNAKEWVDVYIRKESSDLTGKYPPNSRLRKIRGVLLRNKIIVRIFNLRNKIINFLAKDNPKAAPIFIYIIMGSLLILSLMGVIVLSWRWWV